MNSPSRRIAAAIQPRFRLDRSGRVTAVEVVRSSGFSRLSEAARSSAHL
ncbi:MAG: hypothetical protein HC869_15610 [Rhodospirillales bacterium]|nr:hypothetical protein [Rhodospirillales bacterium]